MFNPNIFRSFDIRGKYPEEVNEEAFYKIGQVLTDYLKAKKFLVAQDIRFSSPPLKESLLKGIFSQGAEVIDIGYSSTPCFYFATTIFKVKGGLIVTASHLPKEFNGLKIVLAGNIPLKKEDLLNLKEKFFNQEYQTLFSKEKIIKADPTPFYISALKTFIKKPFLPLKIVLDLGNGMAGFYVDKIFPLTNLEIIYLFKEPEGGFPNRGPDPKNPLNRQKIIEEILKEKADLGIMFDSDVDRVYFLDRQGQVIDPNLVSALISQYLVRHSKRKKVLVDVRTSKVVRDFVEKERGRVEVSPAWTQPMKLRMIQDPEIVFSSETSGHYIFADFQRIDDGILAALIFLQALSENSQSLDEIIADFKKNYFIIEETNFGFQDLSRAKEVLEICQKKYEKEGGKIIKIDGLTVQFKDWWFNLRLSQSENFLRLNLEADRKELMEEKKEELSLLIRDLLR
jgi:phosphomannomutase